MASLTPDPRPLPPAFAIIPAAGRSVRMGTPKLLLPWGQRTVLDAVLDAWRASRVSATVVVVHPEDEAIAIIAGQHAADVVIAPTPPLDMKASVTLGLNHVRQRYEPRPDGLWLLAPADMPGLTAAAIDEVLDAASAAAEAIVAATHKGRRGHPVSFRWHLADEVARLPSDQGVNLLLERHAVKYLETCNPAILSDLDTPADYARQRSTQA
jgi:molybdenum cofactor cytidylyltransferase